MLGSNTAQMPLQRSILHHTKQKFKQINSSLLLTSSLISHKHKISLLRKQNVPLASCKGLLKATKINLQNIQEGKCLQQQSQHTFSNIQELKFLVRKLDQDHVSKLGKQNKRTEDDEKEANIQAIQTENALYRGINKKTNRKRIFKGRPQMNAYVKKPNILSNIIQEDKDTQLKHMKRKFRVTTSDTLNKNQLLKSTTTTINKSNDNFVKQKQDSFLECGKGNLRKNSAISFKNSAISFKNSAISFKNLYKRRNFNHFRVRQLQMSEDHIQLGDNRYSATQTIQ